MQSEWSIWSRDIEDEIVPACRELGIAIVPFSPLGRGMLTGRLTSYDDLAEADMRRTHPRFRDGAFDANLAAVDVVRDVAAGHGATPGQVALAWLLAKGDDVVPIPGTKRISYLDENLGAVNVDLVCRRHRPPRRRFCRRCAMVRPDVGQPIDAAPRELRSLSPRSAPRA